MQMHEAAHIPVSLSPSVTSTAYRDAWPILKACPGKTTVFAAWY